MKSISLRFLLALLFAGTFSIAEVFAQCPVTVLSAGQGTSGNARAPSARYRLAQAHYLITAAEMAAAGFTSGAQFNQISWKYSTAPGVLSGAQPLVIWFENTSDVVNAKSLTWGTATGSMTQVHNANTALPNSTTFFDISLSNGNAFTYTGGGMYVAFQWQYCAGTLSTVAVVDCNTSLAASLFQAQSTASCATAATLGATASAFRPATRLTLSNGPTNDGKVNTVYTYGSMPNNFTIGHQIQANIINQGANTYSGNATLSITGANSFSDVQTISSLPSCSTTTVTFAGFTPTSTGTNSVSVTLPSDDNNLNNSLSLNQPVTTNLYSYKYSAPLTGGVGFGGGVFGVFVSKFNAGIPAQINEVKVDFQASTASRQFRLAIYDELAGIPNNLLYISPSVMTISSAAQQAFIPISPTVPVSGNFFVGVVQETANTVNIAFSYQSESPPRSNTFFYANALTGGPWNDFGPLGLPYRSAIEVQFYVPQPPNCAISQVPANGTNPFCPGATFSWASGGGGPTGYDVYLSTVQNDVDNQLPAALVSSNQPGTTYNPGSLTPSTVYYWKVVPRNVDGPATGCSTFSFTTGSANPLPFTEPFVLPFPPNCWSTAGTFIGYNAVSAYGSGTGSAKFDFFNAASGTSDLISPSFVATPAGYVLSFDYAYATFATEIDQLQIYTSSDDGLNYSPLILLNGGPTGILNTGGAVAAAFTPAAAQWNTYIIGLPTGTNRIKFTGITAFGNNLYLDNISVNTPPPVPNCPINLSPANAATGVFRDATLSWANGGGASSYDVYFDVGAGPAVTLVSAAQTTTTYTPAVMAANTQYSWRIVSKNFSGDAVGCLDLTFTTGELFDYCFASHFGCGNGNITNVTFNTLNNTSTCNPPAYENFPASGATTTSVDKSSSYNLSVTTDVSCIISVWLDWNHDGIFSASEWTQVTLSSTANVSSSVSIPIPVSALPGLTGMRIRSRLTGFQNGDVDACLTMGSGEAEDYWITVNCGGTASSNSPICDNSTADLFSGPAGATFSWTGPSGFSSGLQNPQITNALLGTNDGLYNVNITSPGCNENLSTTLVINPLPSVSTGNNAPFCHELLSLNLTSIAPTAVTWAWNGPGGFTSGLPNPSIAMAPSTASGPYNLLVTDANGCQNTSTTNVTIYALPNVGITVVGSTNICTGQTTSDLLATGAVSYSWNTGPVTPLITVSAAGSYTVTGTDNNTCVNTATQIITASSPPSAPVISPAGPVTVCIDQFNNPIPVTLTVTNYNSGLNWSTGETTQAISIDYADFFSVIYTDGNGCFSISNVVQSVEKYYSTNPSGVTSNVPFNNICLGGNITLSVSGGTLGDDAQWVWYSGSCGGTPAGTGPSIIVSPGSTTQYFVRAEGPCNITSCASVNVIVSVAAPLSSGSFIAAAPISTCAGNTHSVTAATVAGATYYNFSGPSGVLFNGNPSPYQSASPTVSVTFNTLPPSGISGWSICVSAGNGCGGGAFSCQWVRAKLSTPIMSGTNNIIGCANTSEIYSIMPVAGANDYTFTLTGNGNINGIGNSVTTNSTSVTVNFDPTWSSGTLCVYASLSCGYNSSARCMNISNTTAKPATISTANTYVCPGGSANFATMNVPGATSYNWSTSVPGAIITPSGTSASILFTGNIPSGSTVCVSAVNVCGIASPLTCIGIANGVPATPGSISGPTSGVCGQSGVNYQITPVFNSTSYNWSVIGTGASISGPSNLSSANFDFNNSSGSVTLSVTAGNSCGSSSPRTLIVSRIPASAQSIVGNTSVCANAVETYSTTGSSGATDYQWSPPSGWTLLSPQGGLSMSMLVGNSSGTMSVSAGNSCGVSGARSLAVSVTCREDGSELSTGLTLYPNPTSGKSQLSFVSSQEGTVRIMILDVTGRKMAEQNLSVSSGINQYDLNVESLAKGFYLLSVDRVDETTKVIRLAVE